jgi:hypothetical protein
VTTHRRSTREQRDLLLQVGIDLDEPWVWITTDGAVTPEHAHWRVDARRSESVIPMDDEARARWEGFEYVAVGRQVDPAVISLYAEGGPMVGSQTFLAQWGDDLYVTLRYQRVTPNGSVLYAELVTGARRRGTIEGAHLKHKASDRAKAWNAMDLLLQGPRPGRPEGRRGPRDPERRRWYLRARDIGWKEARAEHKKAGGTYAEWKPIQRHK